MDQAQKLEDL